jgi:hypothetical protein
MGTVTKRLQEVVEHASKLPPEQQDELAEAVLFELEWVNSRGLAPEQVEEVKRIQEDLRTGTTRLATEEEVEEMWKNFGA